jgi:hypothetical protein
MQMQRVRIIDRQRKRHLTVDIYPGAFRCGQCGTEFPAWGYRDNESRQCLYCDSPLEVCEWRIRWNKQKWEKYFDRVREELGLGNSFLPFIVRGKDGRFYLQFIAPSLLFSVVDKSLTPIEVEFRQ